MQNLATRTRALLAALLATLVGGGSLALVVTSDDKNTPAVVTIRVDGLDAGKAPDRTLTVPAVAIERAASALSGDVPKSAPLDSDDADHTDQRDETPTGASISDLRENETALQENKRATDALPTAGASAGFAGCRTSFVRNQSSRRGVRPTVQILHYTVSPNRSGWSDVNGITAFFNRSSSQASSHFVIDAEGNCAYIVPIEAKAWTAAAGNPYGVQYEIIATGREKSYLGTAGYTKLRSVMAQVSKRTGIPQRRGQVRGCAPSRSGIVQHADGGACWGGHHDIGPFSLSSVLARVASNSCNLTCQRRARHAKAHRDFHARRCGSPPRAAVCKTLQRRLDALHRTGVKF